MQSGISVDLCVSPPPSTASRSINIIICDCLCLGAVHMSFDSGIIMRQACVNCPSIHMICFLSCFLAAKECGSQGSDRPLILCRTILHRLDYTLPPPKYNMTLKRRESSTAGRKGAAALHSRHDFYNDAWHKRLAFKQLPLKPGPYKPIRITLGAAAALAFLLFGAVGSALFYGRGADSPEESQEDPETDRKVLSDFMEPWASGLGQLAATISHPCALQEERAQVCERTMAAVAQEMEDARVPRPTGSPIV